MTKNKKSNRRVWKEKELRPDDSVMPDPKDSDLVIPVMGPTGVGKSTLINTIIGKNRASVGHDLRSHTARIEHFTFLDPDQPTRRIVFVDTPGFDDTYVDDSEILRRIAVWLAKSYSDNMKLAGVIYLHEISQPRMTGTPRKNLEMFRSLCGNRAIRNVILATTKWSEVVGDIGARREQQLSEKYWDHMLQLGSKMYRFDVTRESAWAMVSDILASAKDHPVDSLRIQEELVELKQIIPETEAGRALRFTLKESLETQHKMAEQLRRQGGPTEDLRKTLEENQNKIRSILHQIQELKIPFSRRILAFLGGKSRTETSNSGRARSM